MAGRITGDFETKSFADLQAVGSWVYSEHETTDVICFCYRIDHPDEAIEIAEWWPGQPLPEGLYRAVEAGYLFEAHNVAFEYGIWMNVMARKYGAPPLAIKQLRDTMASACYLALPAKLDMLAKTLGSGGKHPEGRRLIDTYCCLHKPKAQLTIPPEDFRLFLEYCRQDRDEEHKISEFLGDLPERELEIFHFNMEVNIRGVYLDLAGIENAIAIAEDAAVDLLAKFKNITGDIGPRQTAKLKAWFLEQGFDFPNLRKETLDQALKDTELDIPQGPVRDAITTRKSLNKSSLSKLEKMAKQRGTDGRSRFQTRYHGAGTGRETASGWQILNMVRNWETVDPEDLVHAISFRDKRYLGALYGDVMEALSKAGRHWLQAAEGNILRAADYTSVEAIVLSALAGEEWKLEAFRQKRPIYCITGAKVHNMDPSIPLSMSKDDFSKLYPEIYKDGKTGELAFGYQGALNAWLKFDNSGRHTDARIIEMCKAWRAEHPATVGFWRALEAAGLEATEYPGRLTGVGQIGFETKDQWMTMILPNGKRIWYWDPQIKLKMPHWHQPYDEKGHPECFNGTCNCRLKPTLSYMAVKQGHFTRVYTYGGHHAENATQATSREIMMPAAMAANKAGYHVILTVYDEVVAETRKGFGSVKEFEQIIMDSTPPFARDWPLSAKGWEGPRFKK